MKEHEIQEMEAAVDQLLSFYKSPDCMKRHGKYHKKFIEAIEKLAKLRERIAFGDVQERGHLIWMKSPEGKHTGPFSSGKEAWRETFKRNRGEYINKDKLREIGWCVEVLLQGLENRE